MKILVIGRGAWSTRLQRTLENRGGVDVFSIEARSTEFQLRDAIAQHDGVVVVTRPERHAVLASMALEQDRPVFVEKPLATSVRGIGMLQRQAREKNLPFIVDHVHLFHPGFRQLVGLIGEDEPSEVDVVVGGPGPIREYMSALWDYGPHAVAYAYALLRHNVSSVSAAYSTARMPVGDNIVVGWQCGRTQNAPVASLLFGNSFRDKICQVSVKTAGRFYVIDEYADEAMLTQDGVPLIVPDKRTPLEAAFDLWISDIRHGTLHGNVISGIGFAVGVTRELERIEAGLKKR